MRPRPTHLLLGAIALLGSGCGPVSGVPGVELEGYRPAGAELLRARGWRTDLGRAAVPIGEIRVGPVARGAFRPVREPRFARARDLPLHASEPVLVHRGERGARAWPLAHLLERELVLDEVEGVPVAVTLCSLCGSARVWDRRLDGEVLELAVSGLLLGGNALLHDAQTESLWRQLDGRAVAGAHAGRRLDALPAFTVSLGALRAAHPDAEVLLAPEPGGAPDLDRIAGEDVASGAPPRWLTTTCERPLDVELAVDDGPGGAVLLRDPATAVPHRAAGGGPGPVLGSVAAFRAEVEGRALRFDPAPGGGALDRETGSRWNALGEAVQGPLRGRRLEPLPCVLAFRFALER